MKAFLLKLWARLGPWVHRLLSENNGTPSSTRVLMYGWHGLVAVVWLGDCVVHRSLVWKEGILAILGMVTGAKVVAKFAEPDGPPCDKPQG